MKRVLVLGGGLIGIRHLEAVQAHPECTLVGLADPNMTLAPDVRRFQDMSEVDEQVDGVIIATPTALHAAHASEAAGRGWHMLIEKPVAGSVAEAEVLQAKVSAAGVATLVGHHRRYHACVHQLKSLIADGRIGRVITASMIWAMRKPDSYFHGNWRTAGGSPVMINLVHDIDLLRFVLGEIVDVSALCGQTIRDGNRIESGAIAMVFDNGATGTISFADTAPSPWGFEAGTGENPNIGTTHQDMLWITGTKGAVSFPSMTLWSGKDWGSPAVRTPHKANQNTHPPLRAQLDHFLDVIDGALPLIDVNDATRTLAVAEEIEGQLRATISNKRKIA